MTMNTEQDKRDFIAEDIMKVLKDRHTRGVLLAGAGGTGLRTFVREKILEKPKDPKKPKGPKEFPKHRVIKIPVLPTYNLTEALVAVVHAVAEFGLRLFSSGSFINDGFYEDDGGGDATTNGIQQTIRKLIDLKDEGKDHVDIKALIEQYPALKGSIDRLNGIVGCFILAHQRSDETLTFSRQKGKREVGAQPREIASPLDDEFSFEPNSWLDYVVRFGESDGAQQEEGAALRKSVKDYLARDSHRLLNPYTPTIAARILNELFNHLKEIMQDTTKKHGTLAVVVLNMGKYPMEEASTLLSTLREVTRDQGASFPLLVTADLPFYCQWRDGILRPDYPLRSVFDRVFLIPPPMPEVLKKELKRYLREDKPESNDTATGESKTGASESESDALNKAAYMGCGIFQLSKQILFDKRRSFMDKEVRSNPKAEAGEEDPWNEVKEVFEDFVQRPGHTISSEPYLARLLFMYDILHEINDYWAGLGEDHIFDPSIVFEGRAAQRHRERDIGEPLKLLKMDLFTKIAPIVSWAAGKFPKTPTQKTPKGQPALEGQPSRPRSEDEIVGLLD